ncbi:hypothetical protein DOTSEDRAFT_48856 [Dothistroma septosporum NZE10]|uniref:DUF1254 domain-containing protein n=1 Tax=Dothistroma septosporum (strain NZE10 / CBS 128990) TaxID=675120 RepID=N1Q123_DOTSN|nr:hypothetical protein DOTSEDRAFT_48856 [Dothistroma septosporum NZE10]
MRHFTATATLLCASVAWAQSGTTAQDATVSAITYGYPLLAFQKLATPFVSGNITNYLYHMPKLATAADRTVVKPNVDTLYSVVIYDLSQADLSLTIPDIIPASQFALFSFYDPYGDNYANAGTGNFNRSGQYLIQAPLSGSSQFGLEPVEGQSEVNSTVASVHSPTTYGIILVRWLVKSGNEDDIRRYQNATRLQPVQRLQRGDAPALTSLSIANTTSSTPAVTVLQLLSKLAFWNQPQLANQTNAINESLTAAGINDGTYSKPDSVDIATANSSADGDILGAAESQSNDVRLNNGWSITRPGLAGNFDNGTNYAYRAAIASIGYLMLQAPNAVYPSWSNTSATNISESFGADQFLGPDEAYVYTFSRKPPLMSTGFWSITAYADNYLIPNNLDRYQLGDRSNLTFPSGTPVYGDNATDGTFQVLVQAADRTPPATWTSNWLPGPAGGGNMTALLRWYGAENDLLDGTYVYPVVTKRAAIVADGSDNGSATTTAGSSTVPVGSSAGTASPAAYTGGAVRSCHPSHTVWVAGLLYALLHML